jgi:hypothetical protein
MTEREIRRVLAEVFEELGRLAAPGLLGAGLALGAGGCGDRNPAPTDAVVPRPETAYGVPDRGRFDKFVPGDFPVYMAPDLRRLDGLVPKPDKAYGVPPPDKALKKDEGGPIIPPYMAPDVGTKIDKGPTPLYLGPPPPDAKP